MLRELRIRNLALIDEANLVLHPGFVVVSGETGAGKSLLISAIDLLTGRKADAAMVRQAASKAEVTGRFVLDSAELCEAVGTVVGELKVGETLELSRHVLAESGRSVAILNGRPVPLKVLQSLGGLLTDHVGQHQTRGLARESTRTSMLDRFGELTEVVESYRDARQRYESARRLVLDSESSRAADEAERERIRYDLEELERLAPVAGEPQSLMAEAKRLSKADEIRRLASAAYHALSESDTAIHDQLAKVARKLLPIASLSEALTQAHTSLVQMLSDLDEIAYSLAAAGEAAQADPRRSDAIEKRLAEYRHLARRFSVAEDDLPTVRAQLEERLNVLEGRNSHATDPTALPGFWTACRTAADKLVEGRRSAAARLSAEIGARLHRLGLESAEVTVDVAPFEWPDFAADLSNTPENPASIQFMFRPNPGEPAAPVERIASGGELSRLMLACMSCLADSSGTSTVILDEIDSGVGGRLGSEIGSVIAELARHHQVICITHLPQIASQADQHLLVRKSSTRQRTATTVEELATRESRVEELAAMLRGKKADSITKAEAAAMLEHGQNRPEVRPAGIPSATSSRRVRAAR